MQNDSRSAWHAWLVAPALLAVCYHAGARLGQMFPTDAGNASLIWPSAGIALAGLLRLGWRAWPGVWLGSFITNLVVFSHITSVPRTVIMGMCAATAAGATLEALAGRWLCTRNLGPCSDADVVSRIEERMLQGRLGAFQFGIMAIVSALVSTVIGPAVLCAAGIHPWQNYVQVAGKWVVGDASGILLVAPFLMTVIKQRSGKRLTAVQWWELVLSCLMLLFVTWAVFAGWMGTVARSFFPTVPLLWIAVRTTPGRTTVALAAFNLLVSWHTLRGSGPLATPEGAGSGYMLLSYLWVMNLTALTVACNVAALQHAQGALRERNEELETTLAAIPAFVWISHDPHCGRIVGNATANALLRSSKGDNVSASAPTALTHREFKEYRDGQPILPEDLPMQRAVISGSAIPGEELDMVFKDGDVRTIYGNAVPLFDETKVVRGCIGAFVDITERKQAEANLQRLNAELEQRVSQRTAELRETNKSLNHEIAERQRLEEEILNISEREQSRIGQDLHDGVGQQLAGIGFFCKVLADRLKTEGHPQAGRAAELGDMVQESLNITRDLARSSYPVQLETGGLIAALQGLADQTSRHFGLNCEVNSPDDAPFCRDLESAIHVYRIVQEAVTNAIKHGHAQHIRIDCTIGGGFETVTVTDDGAGFAPPAESTGMGLRLMQHRARLINAELTVRAVEPHGCKVTCNMKAGQSTGATGAVPMML